MRPRVQRIVVLSAIACLVVASGAQGRIAANPVLEVYFAATGDITVTLPNGAALGATSGTPPVIPAGYYTIDLSGPGGCTWTPYFELTGPGEDIVDNLAQGQIWSNNYNADFLPNSTYSWTNSATPTLLHTFTTSQTVVGSPPVLITATGTGSGSKSSNVDIVGSDVTSSAPAPPPFRGVVRASVSRSGAVSLTYQGKPALRLKAGRYVVSVSDESSVAGLMLELGTRALTLSGSRFVGTTSTSVELTPGAWLVASSPGKAHTHTLQVA